MVVKTRTVRTCTDLERTVTVKNATGRRVVTPKTSNAGSGSACASGHRRSVSTHEDRRRRDPRLKLAWEVEVVNASVRSLLTSRVGILIVVHRLVMLVTVSFLRRAGVWILLRVSTETMTQRAADCRRVAVACGLLRWTRRNANDRTQ